MSWCVYLIENKGCTYVGVSPDPLRRLKCHNGTLSGGARYCLSKGEGWRHVFMLWDLDKISAMQLEWSIKHSKPLVSGKKERVAKTVEVLNYERWTSNSRPSSEYNLVMHWYDEERYECLNNLPSNVKIVYETDRDQ